MAVKIGELVLALLINSRRCPVALAQIKSTPENVPVGVVPSNIQSAPAVPAAQTEEDGGLVPVETLTAARVPGVEMFPLESIVQVAHGVWAVVVPPPVISAVLVSEPAPTTVTVPDPAGVDHVQSPRRNVLDEGVPVQVEELTVLNVPPPAAFE